MAKDLKRQLNSLIGKHQKRAFTTKGSAPAYDEEKRTVDVAISSDEPIFHGFAYIILDHSPQSINMERFAGGMAFLENHNADRRLGRLNGAASDGHILRATARFSHRPYADEIFREVVDDLKAGDQPGTSLLFTVDEVAPKPEAEIDGFPVFRAVRWTPYEGSVVSIPADVSVGVGRAVTAADVADEDPAEEASESTDEEAAEEGEEEGSDPADDKTTRGKAAHTPIIVRTAMADLNDEKEIQSLGEMLNETEMARDFIAAGKPPAEFRAAVNEKRKSGQTNVTQKPLVELNAREQKQYSICRAILADASNRPGYEGERVMQGFELDVHQEIAKTIGVSKRGGIYVPTVVSREQLQRAGLDAKTSTKGLEIVFTEPGSFIEMLRNRAVVMSLGVTMLPGLQGNIAFPRQTGAGTFTWTGENPGSDVAESNLTLDQVAMSPKTGQSTTSFSRQLLNQGVLSVDQLVMGDLATIAALEIDRVVIHGSGASNQPRGIYATSGVGSVAFGGAITFGKTVDMETAIAGANGDIGAMAYLTTPNVRGTAKQTARLANTIGSAIWENGEVNGYRAEASNQVSKVLGTGNDHGIVFGVWGQVIVGEWGAMEIITDPYAKKKQGMIEVTEFLMVDVAVRQPAALCKGTTLVP
jgi:HK97 family phage major capsid protein